MVDWPRNEVKIVGGHRCPAGAVPFVAARVVVERGEEEPRLLIVDKVHRDRVEGEVITREQWERLLSSEGAIALKKAIDVRDHAQIWAFAPHFTKGPISLNTALNELEARDQLVHIEPRRPNGTLSFAGPAPMLAVVDNNRVRNLRRRWHARAHDSARGHLSNGDLEEAESAANLAFSLLDRPEPQDFAVLIQVYAATGRRTRSDGYRELARRSYGDDYVEAIDRRVEKIEVGEPKLPSEPTKTSAFRSRQRESLLDETTNGAS